MQTQTQTATRKADRLKLAAALVGLLTPTELQKVLEQIPAPQAEPAQPTAPKQADQPAALAPERDGIYLSDWYYLYNQMTPQERIDMTTEMLTRIEKRTAALALA